MANRSRRICVHLQQEMPSFTICAAQSIPAHPKLGECRKSPSPAGRGSRRAKSGTFCDTLNRREGYQTCPSMGTHAHYQSNHHRHLRQSFSERHIRTNDSDLEPALAMIRADLPDIRIGLCYLAAQNQLGLRADLGPFHPRPYPTLGTASNAVAGGFEDEPLLQR